MILVMPPMQSNRPAPGSCGLRDWLVEERDLCIELPTPWMSDRQCSMDTVFLTPLLKVFSKKLRLMSRLGISAVAQVVPG
mmetsp:Transcript_14713/g.38911  ORF Transcript_14713/g.38911 Transcript_14713/m.38911 type:complete len:80 (+) Transcript_14713:264-503(+)